MWFDAAVRVVVIVGVMMMSLISGAAESAPAVSPGDVAAGLTPGVVPTQYGDVEVPGNPQRVVALSEYALDAAVAVGVHPVGAIATSGGNGVAAYIADRVPDITIVGRQGEISVDAVLELEPDLILASWETDESTYARFSEVAPTIVPLSIEEGSFTDLRGWEYDVLYYGHALGKTEEIAQALQDVHDRSAALSDGDALSIAGESAVIVRWSERGPVVLGADGFASIELQRLGFVPSGFVRSMTTVESDPLSAGELAAVDADWFFMAIVDEEGRVAYDSWLEDPSYREKTAHEDMNVHAVDGAVWASSAGPLAAHAMFDEIESMIASLKD